MFFPSLRRLAILGNTDSASAAQEMTEAEAAAGAWSISSVKLVTHHQEEISPAFEGLDAAETRTHLWADQRAGCPADRGGGAARGAVSALRARGLR